MKKKVFKELEFQEKCEIILERMGIAISI